MGLPSDPKASAWLMQLTWLCGAIGFWGAFGALANSELIEAISWVNLWVVGVTGVLSFFRHAVFHRSDAARMGWNYGRRNAFQLEVGFANLAWGSVAITAWAQGWSLEAQGAVVMLFGIYMVQAAVLHWIEFAETGLNQRRRVLSRLVNSGFAGLLLWFGALALNP